MKRESESGAQPENGHSTINEALKSLKEVLDVLQSMSEGEQEVVLKMLEHEFPEEGVDFQEAVQKYEVNLIKQALRITNGHQANAAKLLHLKITTLNSIIKRYGISTSR